MSHADIERILRRAAKDMILSGSEFLNKRHIEAAVRREDARKTRIQGG
jgi:AAA+ superfamily predicted ATPase